MFKDKVLEHDDFAFGEAERGPIRPGLAPRGNPARKPNRPAASVTGPAGWRAAAGSG